MPPVLVDANVLIDILDPSSAWTQWSLGQIDQLASRGLVINPIVYAEIAPGFENVAHLTTALGETFLREDLPWSGAFRAGHAYRDYRRRGGDRRSPLPDFFIGAHAEIAGYELLTRDARRYRTYFPTVRLIAPDSD